MAYNVNHFKISNKLGSKFLVACTEETGRVKNCLGENATSRSLAQIASAPTFSNPVMGGEVKDIIKLDCVSDATVLPSKISTDRSC